MTAVSSSRMNRFSPDDARCSCSVSPNEMPEMFSAPTTMPAAAPISTMSSAARPVSRIARTISRDGVALAAIAEHQAQHDQDARSSRSPPARSESGKSPDRRCVMIRNAIGIGKCQPDFRTSQERRHVFVDLRGADLVLGGLEIDVHEQRGVVEQRRNGGGDADRAIGDLQELRHDEGGGAHHRRHELAAGRADRFDRRRAVGREARAHHQRNGDDADRHHVADRGAGDHAEQRRADHRDLGGAAAKVAHRRHGDVGEIGRAAGAAEHLAHERERHHDQHRDAEQRRRSCR